uniref:Uncharacterized protein n=1 Tax=Anguilla anguilla TaxID=7936 RepID=A0A0E9Q2J6_ANGAN
MSCFYDFRKYPSGQGFKIPKNVWNLGLLIP